MGSESYEKISKSKMKSPYLVWVLVFGILMAAAFILIRLYELERPQVSLLADAALLGRKARLDFALTDAKSGLQSFSVVLVQDKLQVKLAENSYAREGWLVGGPKRLKEIVEIDAVAAGVMDGRADLVVTVRDFSFWQWLKGNESVVSYPLVFDTKPPQLRLVDAPLAMKPGGAGIITYRANEEIAGHGVTINGDFHPGFPLAGRSDLYGAMIGLPHDTENIAEVYLSALDRAGNSSRMAFGLNLRKVRKVVDRINISDPFLNQKIPEFADHYPELVGDLLEKYLYVNNEVRAQNYLKIREVCRVSVPERLWEGPFQRLRRSARRAGFAEYRSYFYDGKKIDNQVHLGIDLASVRQAPVEAANSGKVVFADYLGIYGNMVIVDHGQGVFSLYSHLSKISVAVGETVGQGAELGNTGTSGMAGGDHLHFAVLVNGIFVNPLEWWDQSWLELNILNYL